MLFGSGIVLTRSSVFHLNLLLLAWGASGLVWGGAELGWGEATSLPASTALISPGLSITRNTALT